MFLGVDILRKPKNLAYSLPNVARDLDRQAFGPRLKGGQIDHQAHAKPSDTTDSDPTTFAEVANFFLILIRNSANVLRPRQLKTWGLQEIWRAATPSFRGSMARSPMCTGTVNMLFARMQI